MTYDTTDQLTDQARAGVRRAAWRSVALRASRASTIGLLGAAGLAPLLAAVSAGTLTQCALAQWLVSMGGNALAGWAGDLALWAAGQPLASADPVETAQAHKELAIKLDELLSRDAQSAAAFTSLLRVIDAAPQSMEALQEEIGAQSDLILEQYELLQHISADTQRWNLAGAALGPVVVTESNRVITALEDRIDHRDAQLAQRITELRALCDTERQGLLNFGQGSQFDDLSIGDVAGRDIIKHMVVSQPFTPGPVAATPKEIAAAAARLADLPADTIPEPADVLPAGSWLGQLSRNRQFVGREADLRALARLLKGATPVVVDRAQTVVISGMGGVGKTQLAVEFAYRYGRYFAGVFWLSFAQPEAIAAEIAYCGGAGYLQLFTEAAGLELAEQVNLVRARWTCGLPYLLICDNCEDPELLRQFNPGGATRVLVTSRTPEWPGDLGVQRHPLDVLDRLESKTLLRQQRSDLCDADAGALAAELGDLPLALHLAGRFLAGPGKGLTMEYYLAELRSSRIFERLSQEATGGRLPTGHDRDVVRTFALSYERLDPNDATDGLALLLLARAAHLVPGEVIPAWLLRAILVIHGNDQTVDVNGVDVKLTAETVLQRLIGLGLLDRTDADLRMHRLVGAYIRQISTDTAAQADVERMVLAVARHLGDARTFSSLMVFMPILRGVTDMALPREDLGGARLGHWLANHLRRLGDYATARHYAERALVIRERLLGPTHPDTASSLHIVAALLKNQGDYAAARPMLERALAIREQELGPDHPDTASSLNNLAALLRSQGDYAAARPVLERAVAIRKQTLGLQHPALARSLNNLAELLAEQGRYAEAQPLYERALAIKQQVLGRWHPETARSLNDLASLLYRLGDYAAAQPIYEQALAIREQKLGPDHPATAESLNNLAELLRRQGDYAAAQPLYKRALAIREQALGPQHPATAESLDNLAELLHSRGDYDTARSLYERALAICEQKLGPQHPATAESLNNLAELLTDIDDDAAARPLYERALTIYERVLGPQHPNTAESLHNLALLSKRQEDYSAARPLYERALVIYERALGPDHPNTQTVRRNLTTLDEAATG
ncbi:MAG: tetratricopeptide repeat protein [Chloroflexales bacterium]|nr:tetratricopeptide repeat protein [Chloroflexales bacterium]